MLSRIRQLLAPPVLENEAEALAASLLRVILIIFAVAGLVVPLLLNVVAVINPNDAIEFEVGTFIMGLIVPLLALGLLSMLHEGRVRLASVIITATLFVLTTSTIITFRGTRDTASGMYILVIAMAGLLLGGQAAVLFMILSLLVTFGIYIAEVNGLLIVELTETPEIVEWIIFAVIIFLISILLRFAFQTLSRALRETQEVNEALEGVQVSLEDRVAARTRDLELAAEVGHYISGVRESEEILVDAVEIIRARFGLYYTQIYLVDPERNNLVLRAGTGTVGRQLLQLGHRLQINDNSINGMAVLKEESVIVANTAESDLFRPNRLLPETRSELAVPLIVSGTVTGVLNVQSDQAGELTEENLPAFEALAGQLAIALDNARLFTETTEAQSAVESLARRLARTSWESYLNAIDRQETISYTFDNSLNELVQAPTSTEKLPSFSVPLNLGGEVLGSIEVHGQEWDGWKPGHKELAEAVAERVAQQIENLRLLSETERYRFEAEEASRRLTKEGWESFIEGQLNQPDGYLYDQQQVMPLPSDNGYHEENDLVYDLTVRGESVGQIEIEGVSETDEEAAELIEAVAERLSAHIENLRLVTQTEVALAETERRAEELAVINELARTVSQQLNLAKILETAYEQVSRILSADAFFVGLYDQETNLINYPLMYDEGVRFEEGTHYLDKDTTVYEVLKTGKSIIVGYESEDDLPDVETLEKNAMGNESKASRSMMFVPLIFSNYIVGIISVQSYEFHAYDEDDVALVEGIASHLSVAIQNAQLFEQTQKALAETEEQASRLALLTELGQALTQAQSLDEIYEVTAQRAHKIVGSDRASIALLSEDGEYYDILALGGEKGSTTVGERQPLEGSSVGQAVEEKRLIVVNKTEDSGISGIYSFMVAPLVSTNQVIGTLNIGSKSTNLFGSREEKLILQIATLLATTIESRRLLAQTRQRAEQLAFVNRIAQTISQELERDQMLDSILEEVSQALPVDAFLIGLYDQDTDLLEYPLIYDDGRRYQIESDHPPPESTVFKVLQNKKPILLLRSPEEVAERSNEKPETMVGNQSKVSASLMYVPLFLGKRSIGVVSIQTYEYNAYGADDLILVENLASHVAIALENARLFEETQRRAEELSVVNQVARVVSQMRGLNELYAAVHEQIHRALISDAFFIALHDKENNTISYPYLFDDGDHYALDPVPVNPDLEVVQVINSGKPILINYADNNLAEKEAPSDALLATKKAPVSMIFVPLHSGKETVGVISTQNYQPHHYTQTDVDLLVGIANHLAVALENARLFSETEQKAEELAVVNEIAQAVSGQIEQEDLLKTVYEQIRRIMPVDAFSVTVFDPDIEMITYLMVMDEGKQFQESPTPLGSGAISRVIIEGQPILINRTAEELDELSRKQDLVLIGNTQRFSASMIYVPLQIGIKTIGGLSVQSYTLNSYDQPEVELLVGIANHVAVALENARLFEETQITLAETELLYNMGTQINRAATLEDLVSVIGVPGIAPEAQSAGLFRFELNDDGQAEWMELEANWVGDGEAVLSVGSRLHLPEIPLAAAELYTPNEPLLIGNIATDERVDDSAKTLLQGLNSKAIAIIPMQQLETWIGTLIIRWEHPYQFGPRENRLYNSLARQMSTALSNQLLLTQTQDRAAQLEKINQIETALSQADDEAGIIQALTLLSDNEQSISLYYTAEENQPKNVYMVAHWENGEVLLEEDYPHESFDVNLHPGLAVSLKQPDRITYVSDVKSDVRISKKAAKEAKGYGYRSVMVVPLRSAGRWQGFVSVKWEKTHIFSRNESSVWEQLREPLAAVVASRRAYEQAETQAREARNRSNELAILNEMGRSLTALVDMDAILESVYRYTARLMDANNFYVAFYNVKQKEISFALDIRGERVMRNAGVRKAGKGLTEHIINTREPLLIPDNVDAKLDELGIEKIGPSAASWLGVPLMVGSQVIGVIGLQNWDTPGTYNEQHLRLLTSVAGQAAIAVENARLFEQIQARARRERILREVTAKVRGATDADSVMRTAVQEIGKALGRRTFVYLNQNQQNETEIIEEEAYGD